MNQYVVLMAFTSAEHETYMDKVINLACQNLKRPFATIIVDTKSGEVLAEGLNKAHKNPTLHSEMVAISQCIERGHDRWENYILYTTAEPNPMCMSALLWTGIPTVVYGSSRNSLHDMDFREIPISASEIVERAKDLHCELIGGVVETRCDELFSAASRVNKV